MTLTGLTLNLISLEQTSHKLQCLQTAKGLLLYILGMASSDAYLPLLKSILPFNLLNYILCLPNWDVDIALILGFWQMILEIIFPVFT